MIDPSKLLAALPPGLRDPLRACYKEIVRNYIERRWEPAELNGGKFCEIVYAILDGALSGTYATGPTKPANMLVACRALEQLPSVASRVGDRSLRIQMPRLLPFLYEIRNNRNVGHVGGEVDPNHADAEVILSTTSWIMAELVRIFHAVPLEEAQQVVDALVERHHPLIWKVEGKKRVLDTSLSMKEKTLALLYSEPGWVSLKSLCEWVEYSRESHFRTKVLRPAHKSRLLELDLENSRVKISPLGVQYVEENVLTSEDPS